MRQCNGKVSPSKAQVKGLAKELKIDESFLPGAPHRNLRLPHGAHLQPVQIVTPLLHHGAPLG
jgi:hypothetical protein